MKDSNTVFKKIYSSIQYVFLHHLCQHKEPWTNKAHVRTEQKLHTFWGYSFLYSGQKPCPLFVSFGTRTGLLSFFLQKCKSSFRAHSCSLSMSNFFLKKMLAHQFWPQLIVCNPSLSDCHLPKPEQRKGIWKACLHYNIVVRPWVQEIILRLDSRVFEVDRENDLKYNFMKKIMENLVQDNFQISWNWFWRSHLSCSAVVV